MIRPFVYLTILTYVEEKMNKEYIVKIYDEEWFYTADTTQKLSDVMDAINQAGKDYEIIIKIKEIEK